MGAGALKTGRPRLKTWLMDQCNQSIETAVIARVSLDGSTTVCSFTESNQGNKQNYQFEVKPCKLPCYYIHRWLYRIFSWSVECLVCSSALSISEPNSCLLVRSGKCLRALLFLREIDYGKNLWGCCNHEVPLPRVCTHAGNKKTGTVVIFLTA